MKLGVEVELSTNDYDSHFDNTHREKRAKREKKEKKTGKGRKMSDRIEGKGKENKDELLSQV